MIQLGAKGKIGPVALGIGYMQEQKQPPIALEDTTVLRVGAKANFGGFDVAALFQQVSDQGGAPGLDQTSYGVGVGFKMGNNYLKAQYYIADDFDNVPVASGATMLAVGWDYLASKTTTLYVTYAKLDLDNVAYTLGGNGHGTSVATNVVGGSASGLSAGMIINF